MKKNEIFELLTEFEKDIEKFNENRNFETLNEFNKKKNEIANLLIKRVLNLENTIRQLKLNADKAIKKKENKKPIFKNNKKPIIKNNKRK